VKKDRGAGRPEGKKGKGKGGVKENQRNSIRAGMETRVLVRSRGTFTGEKAKGGGRPDVEGERSRKGSLRDSREKTESRAGLDEHWGYAHKSLLTKRNKRNRKRRAMRAAKTGTKGQGGSNFGLRSSTRQETDHLNVKRVAQGAEV